VIQHIVIFFIFLSLSIEKTQLYNTPEFCCSLYVTFRSSFNTI